MGNQESEHWKGDGVEIESGHMEGEMNLETFEKFLDDLKKDCSEKCRPTNPGDTTTIFVSEPTRFCPKCQEMCSDQDSQCEKCQYTFKTGEEPIRVKHITY